jgi:hypothetical protein
MDHSDQGALCVCLSLRQPLSEKSFFLTAVAFVILAKSSIDLQNIERSWKSDSLLSTTELNVKLKKVTG